MSLTLSSLSALGGRIGGCMAGAILLMLANSAGAAGLASALDIGPDGNPIIRFAAPETPTPAPDIHFVDTAGTEHSLGSYRGKVTAVHFWATWCVPCRSELPQVEALASTLNGPAFEVLPISVDREGIEVVTAFYNEQGITKLPAYLDRGLKAFRAFRLSGVPATIFIDAEGNEIARVLGDRDWARPEVLDVVRKLIAGG